MPNANYIKGRNFEYAVMRNLREEGYEALRTAGSHGNFDIVAIHKTQPVIDLVQCKVVDSEAEVTRLYNEWRKNPPYPPLALPKGVHQLLYVKVHGSSKWNRIVI